MKKISVCVIFLIGLMSCKKELSPSNSPNSPAQISPVFYAGFNYIQDGGFFVYEGVPNSSSIDPELCAEMTNDSILQLMFKQKDSDRWITIRLEEHGGDAIGLGTYDLSSPFGGPNDYRLAMTSSGSGLGLYFGANSEPSGITYLGEPLIPFGQLEITGLSPTEITGTLYGNLYSSFSSISGYQKKLEVASGSFTGKIKYN